MYICMYLEGIWGGDIGRVMRCEREEKGKERKGGEREE